MTALNKNKELSLTRERLLELFHHESDSGLFIRKKSVTNSVCAGDVAGTITNGYGIVTIDRKQYRAHRLAWFYVYGIWPSEDVDHINGIKTDNRISNLRCASRSENACNTKTRADNTSGFKGVSWCKMMNKWFAYVNINKKRIKVGYFHDKDAAAEAVRVAREKLHKGFHNHGA